MKGYNMNGVDIAGVKYSRRCQYGECERGAYYKFVSSNAIGKAIVGATRHNHKTIKNANGTPIMVTDYGAGYFCSFDCARKNLLVKTFEAKVRLTPLVKNFLGQGKIPIHDYETFLENGKDVSIVSNGRIATEAGKNFIKISPNGPPSHPVLIDYSWQGLNYPIGFSIEGAKKLVSALQHLIDSKEVIATEKESMKRKKRLDKIK